MSVYTMPQTSNSAMGQTGYGSQDMFSQQSWQSPFGGLGAQGSFGSPHFAGQHFGPQQAGWQQYGGGMQSQWVTEAAARIATTAVAALAEQLRFDQQTLQGICSQGQLPQQSFAQLVAESTRRIAPVVAATVGALTATTVTSALSGQQGMAPHGMATPGIGVQGIGGQGIGGLGIGGQGIGQHPAMVAQLAQQIAHQLSTSQNAYGPGSYGQNSYGQNSYGPSLYAQSLYGQSAYAQPGYGQQWQQPFSHLGGFGAGQSWR